MSDIDGPPVDDGFEALDGPSHGRAGPVWRGVLVVAVAVVLGILLLPSATRPPVGTSLAASTSTPPTSLVPSSTTTTTTPPPPAPEVHVLVANATVINGVAGAVTTFLGTKGYSTLTATNATAKVSSTEVFPVSGAVGAASEVATALDLPAASIQGATVPVPVASYEGATVVVIAGPDLAARFVPSSATTTTTG